MRNSFDYAVLRVVPFTEREEFFNAGVVLFCAEQRYLGAKVRVDASKLSALAPDLKMEEVQQRLDAIVKICSGEPEGGPIAQLSPSARFHWLVAPRSTLIQPSAVHSGLCEDPARELERVFREMVVSGR
ncbi:MAG TPA: DUF3037 domain-containing protein [Bryobacteraceae bacterium]|jgi:hypothetical protein|nr:DUF3037 domain-containing protein [Bryobacteraceae bacterium]